MYTKQYVNGKEFVSLLLTVHYVCLYTSQNQFPACRGIGSSAWAGLYIGSLHSFWLYAHRPSLYSIVLSQGSKMESERRHLYL